MAILQSETWRSSWGYGCLVTAALIASTTPVEARGDARLRIDIDAATLTEAIAQLSREAQVSVGTEGALPRLQVRPLHGRLSVDAALARLLRGSGYLARRVGPTAWRIERARAVPKTSSPTELPPAVLPPQPAAEIVVSATKRPLTLADAPLAATVVQIGETRRFDPANDTQRVAERVEGLSLTGQGPGRNRMFLRGVADSPFGGKSPATVAVLLDDTRLTYVAPDPDIRLVDVARIELLKGPQGSLYGSGALGGIYRIVANRPDPSAFSIAGSISGQTIAAGEFGMSGSLVANVPLIADLAALRLVGYGEKSPGWLNTGERESNGSTVVGLRAGIGIAAGGGWRADLMGFGQWLQVHDSSYTYRPEAHERSFQLPEPHDNDLVHGSFRLAHDGATQIVLSSGYTVHGIDDRYDATQGASAFGLPDPESLDDDAHYLVWDSEARITGNWGRIGMLGGVSHVDARQKSTRVLQGAGVTALILDTVDRKETETALFGEATLPFAYGFKATLGGRLYHTSLRERRTTAVDEGVEERPRTGVTPSASVSWNPRSGHLLYIRYGSAVRQGGTTVGASGEVERLDEDELTTIEGGWRGTVGNFAVDLGLYHSWWRDIQSDALLANGLVETANVGDGAITGAEVSLKAPLLGGWHLDAGAMLQSALLTRDMSGLHLEDRRLPVVPSWTVRGAVQHGFAVGRWQSTVSASARYIGPARLSFDPALDRPMGNYIETGLSFEARRGRWVLGLEGRNLLDARGDSFAYGNPLRIFSAPQFVRQDPFSLRLSVTVTP
jgi:outer membrane receptor protein involved in Fe transport